MIYQRAKLLHALGLMPLPLNGKRPYLKGWTQLPGFTDADIDSYFSREQHNLGLCLGKRSQNIVCVDIDPKNGGDKWLAQHSSLTKVCGCIEHSGKGDGGCHLFFIAPEEKYLKSCTLADGVDYLAEGKQVVLAPSLHEETGKRYVQTKGDLQNIWFDILPLPQNIMSKLDELYDKTIERAVQPVDLDGKTITDHEVAILTDKLKRLDSGKGRHNVIGGWVTDAVAAGADESWIVEHAENWMRDNGRDPQKSEITNWINYARQGLAQGTSYISDNHINPERFSEQFEPVKPELSTESFDQAQSGIRDWLNLLRTDKHGGVSKDALNLMLITQNDLKIKNKIMYDTLREKVVYRECLPWHNPTMKVSKHGNEWTEFDDTNLRLFISEHYGVTFGKQDVIDIAQAAAEQNSFDPLREMVTGFRWDGTERVGTWLSRATGCMNDPYHSEVGRMLLVSLVARAVDPGCKVDNMVILEGEQGNGKSTFCKILAMEDTFFTDTLGRFSDDSAINNTKGKWIVELPEVDQNFRHTEAEKLKEFTAKSFDTYRPSYGRYSRDFKRHFVLIGTTNRDEYLVDRTGNRRFYPITTGKKGFDLDWLRQNREQLYAEAYVMYKKGSSTNIIQEMWQQAKDEAQKRIEADDWLAAIAEIVEKPELQKKLEDQTEGLTTVELYKVFTGNLNVEKLERRISVRLGRCMRDLGYRYKSFRVDSGQYGATQKRWCVDV